MNQRFADCLGQIMTVQNLVGIELGNWKQTQRMFSWEDDRGKAELSSIQQWSVLFCYCAVRLAGYTDQDLTQPAELWLAAL